MALISVIVPVYCNSKSLDLLKSRLDAMAQKLPGDRFEYILVDDGSSDDSFLLLQRLSQADPGLRVLKLSRNFGSNAAMLAGLTHAQGDCAVVISADLQDPPELIPELVGHWKNGFRVVLAARKKRDDALMTRLFAGIFNRLFRRLAFSDFPARGFDFMLIDNQVREIIVHMQERNSYLFGQVLWCGFKRTVIYYDRVARAQGQGKSKWTFVKKIKYFIDAFTAFSYVPIRLISTLGFLMAAAGLLYAMVLVGLRLWSQYEIPPGWAMLTVLFLTISGMQLIFMGILGEYLWRVLDDSRKRPLFLVESTVNVQKNSNSKARGEK